MGKQLHVICGNCGNAEGMSYSVSGGYLVTIYCSRCGSSSDLGDVMLNLTPGIERPAIEYGEINDHSPVWNVVMTNAGQTKLNLVKAIKEITGLGLREAKDLADFQMRGESGIVFYGINRKTAEDAAAHLINAGASVVIKHSTTGQEFKPVYEGRS